MRIRTCRDLEEAGWVWRRLWPAEDIFGCWEARMCFQESFGRDPEFIIAESDAGPAGFLALSSIEEEGYYGHFPGETWKGRTWFEENRIPADSDITRMMLWEAAPEKTAVRYMEAVSAGVIPGSSIDDTGYFLTPPRFGFDYDRYWSLFSGKSRKKLGREIEALGRLEYSHGDLSIRDIDWMFETNRAVFGADSFFEDARFLSGFEKLISFLDEKRMLHVLSVRSSGKPVAVDVGAVVGGRYTIMAGATDPGFPGVAKAINLEHIRWAFAMRFDKMDFLCGDFGWKSRFHLEPRPLFESVKPALPAAAPASQHKEAVSVPAN